ncbi:MAG: ATP-binding protein [bacterium]|nr:ATP-binding protein [bacterium]
MNPKRLHWQLFPGLLLILLITLLLLTALVSRQYGDFFLEYRAQELLARGRILEPELVAMIDGGQWVALGGLAERLGPRGEVRITLVSPRGEFLSDSQGYLSTAEVLAEQPEIKAAIQGHAEQAIRFGYTEQRQMLYVARPLREDARLVGVVRLGVPIESFAKVLSWTRFGAIGLTLGLGLVAALASLLVVKKVAGPLEEIQQRAQDFAQGDLSVRLPQFDSLEFSRLSAALNLMAGQLQERFETIGRQKLEQEAIFTGIGEGLLVLDTEGRVTNLNPAAIEILSLREAKGKKLVEILRNPELERFAQEALATDQTVTAQIEIFQTDRVVRATGSRLSDNQGRHLGVLLAFYDLTHLLRLENVRKEFVANVSHELKTPITSVKGFVETLLDGAMDDPDDAERFLRIVYKHANRLEMIVEDLLSLARIEQEGFEEQLHTERRDLRDLIRISKGYCAQKAQSRQVELLVPESPEVEVLVNDQLAEQALVNLIDNAIKYSPEGSQVTITCFERGPWQVVEVADRGEGVPEADLPRIFERFYRVDKARSGLDSSTGLGLAIVKNILKLHRGQVEVESKWGRGSRFRLLFPRP